HISVQDDMVTGVTGTS
nr:immunoglobulin heavy chain junction region [Mus musculus]